MVLIFGPLDSGKTSLMLRLYHDKFMTTATSQCSNECLLTIGGGRIKLVDTPGSLRLAHELDMHITNARALICMVDSSDKKSLKLAANQIVEILINPKVINKCPSMLIVSNKSDLLTSRDLDQVKDIMELEIERIIEAKKNESHLSKMNPDCLSFINRINTQNFKLDDLNVDLTFTTASVKRGDVQSIRNFIIKHL